MSKAEQKEAEVKPQRKRGAPIGNKFAVGNEGGRPTLYKDEYCARVVELGKQGFTHAMIAADLGFARQTLYEWVDIHKEFNDAIIRARDESQAFLERKGLFGLDMAGFNSGLWGKIMSCRFPEEYREQRSVEMSAPGGRSLFPKQTGIVIGPGATPEQIAAAIAALGVPDEGYDPNP
jgi:hypothetical protein